MKLKQKAKFLGRCVFNISRCFVCCFNYCLCFSLLLSTLFLGGLYFNLKFSLPSKLESFLKEELKKEALILNAKSIKFDLRGNIVIESPRLSFVASASDFFTAKYLGAGLDFSYEALKAKRIALRYIFIEGAELSPVDIDAKDFSLISHLSLSAFRTRNMWSVRNFNSDICGVKVYAKGSLDRRFLLKDENEDRDSSIKDYVGILEDLSANIKQLKAYAENLNYPTLFIDFDISKESIEQLYCIFRAKDVSFPIGENALTLGNVNLGVGLDSKGIESKRAKFIATVENIAFKDYAISSLDLRSSINYGDLSNIKDFSLSDLSLSLDNLNIAGNELGYLRLDTSKLLLFETPQDIDLYIKNGVSFLDAKMTRSETSIGLEFDYFDNPFEYLKLPYLEDFDDLKVIEELSCDIALHFRGVASIAFKNDISTWDLLGFESSNFEEIENIKARAFLLAEGVVFAGETVEEVYGRLDFDLKAGEIFAKDVYLITENGWNINAEIYQGIDSLDYVFDVKGSFEPSCLDNVMAPWWKTIFSDFDLQTYPNVGVYVKGQWGDPEFTWVYAKIKVDKAKYHDYLFEDISLDLNVCPSIICAYDVKLKGGNGEATAYLAWVYDPTFGLENYLYRNIIGSVNMNYDAVKALGGEDVEEIVDILSFEDNVILNFDLYDVNPRRDPFFEQEITFDFETANATKVSYFLFDKIKGHGNAKGQNFYIKDVEASFLDGNLAGDFSIERIDEKNYFKTKLEAKDLNQGGLLALIEDIANDDTSPVDESNYSGKLSSTLSAEGFLLDFDSYVANADIYVSNEELKKVSILGGISRTLEAMRIPITTLEFTEFLGSFTLEDGEMFFPKLEIKSQTSTLFGRAAYAPMTDELSARMYFNWKVASSIPIFGHIADFAFDPILDSILIVISNTLAAPSFSARIRPFNIFNSEETMIENINKDTL